jgi:hypothetical protein
MHAFLRASQFLMFSVFMKAKKKKFQTKVVEDTAVKSTPSPNALPYKSYSFGDN